MQVNYQKSAQRRGFAPVQVSRQNVQNILQQGQQQADNIRRFAESDLNERARQQKGMNAAFNFEQEQAETNYRIVQENIAREERSRQSAVQQDLQAQQALFSSFAKLSATAATAYQKYKTEQDEYQKKADIAEYFSNPEYKAKVDAAFTSMNAQNEAATVEAQGQRNAADVVSADKTPVAQVSKQIRGLSPGQTIAYVQSKSSEHAGFIAKWFADPDSNLTIGDTTYTSQQIQSDPALYSQALSQLRYQFMGERGLTGLSVEALSPGLEVMRRNESQLIYANNAEFVDNERKDAALQADVAFGNLTSAQLVATNLPGIIQNWQYSEGGDNVKVLDRLFGLLERNDIPDDVRQAIYAYKFGPNGETVSSYKGRMDTLRRNLLRTEVSDERTRDARDQQIAENNWNEVGRAEAQRRLDELEGDPIAQSKFLDGLEQSYIDSGVQVSGVSNWIRNRNQTVNQDLSTYLTAEADSGNLSQELVDSIPDADLRDRAQKALDQQEIRTKGPNYVANMETLETFARTLTENTTYPSKDGEANRYQGIIERDLKSVYMSTFEKAVSQGKSYAEAADIAMKAITNESGTGAYDTALLNDEKSRYYRDVDANGYATFPNLPSNLPSVYQPQTVNNALESIYRNPEEIKTNANYISNSQLEQVASSWNANNGTFYVPSSVSRVQRVLEKKGIKMTPFDILNYAIDAKNKAYGLNIQKLKPTPAMKKLNEAPPRVQGIFLDTETLSTMRAARGASQMEGGEHLLQSSVRLPGGTSVGNMLPIPDLKGSAKERTIQLGQSLLGYGFMPWQHKDFKIGVGYTGSGSERVMQRSYNSSHHHGEALDYPLSHNSSQDLDRLYEYLMANKEAYGIKTILWKVKDHYDHLHVDFDHRIIGQ